MKIEFNEIYNYDAIEFMKLMKKQKIVVDAIITDPPYNISRENNFNTIGRAGIDFGEWDVKFDQKKWLKHTFNILKDGGNIIIFNDWKNMGDIARELEKIGYQIKDMIRWIKPNPMPRNVNRRYVTDFEVAIWAVKPGKWTFNKPDGLAYKKPEIIGPIGWGGGRLHPTQKGYGVVKELIEIHTNPGDVVFDPFSGSGQISYVADKLNRIYIATEIDKGYWKASKQRFISQMIKPPFNHLGNKFRMIKQIDISLPKKEEKYDVFVEPFAGSGVVSANYKYANKIILNDKSHHLSSLIEYLIKIDSKTLINKIESYVRKYDFDKNDYKEEYIKFREIFNNEKKKDYSKLILLIILGFNHQIRFNSKGEFNIPSGKTPWSNYAKKKLIDYKNAFKGREVVIFNKDFEDVINEVLKEHKTKKMLFYIDPPYLLSIADYNYNWTEDDERRLIKSIKKIEKNGYKFLLSNVMESKGNENKILSDFCENSWVRTKYIRNISYSNSNYHRKNSKHKDIEVLVSNYDM